MNLNLFKIIIFVCGFILISNVNASSEQGDNEQASEHEEEQVIKLSTEQINTAGIVIEPLKLQRVSERIKAPGEIKLNAYATSSITSRISAQVLKRHARLGDYVTNGNPLLTLSSVEMAVAQGDLLVAEREWERVKKLGEKVVSAQRYTQARVAHEQAKAKALAYGMTENQVKEFVQSGDASQANGTFQLLASQEGTVIHDDFIIGELIEPGRELFVISDESILWVEAHIMPSQATKISVSNPASIMVNKAVINGKVTQIHHVLDEDTRTLGVRIEVANPEDQLHPGVFVQVQINSNTIEQVMAVPVNAVLRSSDGDWIVFIEHKKGEFEPQEVGFVKTVGNLAVIEGIEAGARIVTKGAFFVQSELNKSSFEDDD